jgi:hypothetical protein
MTGLDLHQLVFPFAFPSLVAAKQMLLAAAIQYYVFPAAHYKFLLRVTSRIPTKWLSAENEELSFAVTASITVILVPISHKLDRKTGEQKMCTDMYGHRCVIIIEVVLVERKMEFALLCGATIRIICQHSGK